MTKAATLFVCLIVHCGHPFHCIIFFFNDTATTEIYTLSLHDALPISTAGSCATMSVNMRIFFDMAVKDAHIYRSEEHTSELQSPDHLVFRLLLEKKKNYRIT